MSLRVYDLRVGMHPDERLYELHEADGQVSESFAWKITDRVFVGWPVGHRADGAMLVELPEETLDGRWRVWVRPEELLKENEP